MRIAIIGAGIVGLTAAAGLSRLGLRPEVFEKAPADTVAGAGISLFPSARKAFARLGLAEGYDSLPHGPAADLRTAMRRPDGSIRFAFPAAVRPDVRMHHREELRDFLLAECAGVRFHWGTRATVLDDGGPLRRAELATDPGGTSQWDLILAADGLRSPTRTMLGLDPGLRYTGYSAWRGVTAAAMGTQGTAGEDWGDGQRFGTVPLGDGRVYWFAVTSSQEGRTATTRGFGSEREAALAEFQDWYPTARGLIAGTEPGAVLRHDLYDLREPLNRFHRGRVALLGDAAHAMTPDLGRGAGTGLDDAAELVGLLRASGAGDPDGETVNRILSRYSQRRAPRAARMLLASRWMGRLAQRRRGDR
ncbi:FAD-dependent monooxygenase [Arthrobacter sp. NPDC090010]|uniref:FAD-dependent monooxygenase n=1 Tax=Arthrobacter sp. NPDC090010 TaxID=3363942 RepID=UPI0038097D9C